MKILPYIGLALALAGAPINGWGAALTVSTFVGTGVGGYSDSQLNNPYGMAIGPDGGLYFCDINNQRIRRLDLKTKKITTIAGDGQRDYRGDGGPAIMASLNMPHEVRFDAKGRWTVRFHLHEECADEAPDSPHGHIAFFIDVP